MKILVEAANYITDSYRKFFSKIMRYFRRLYPKTVCSKNYDNYADFNDDLELDINTSNMLIKKAS